ncbi:hypothetical protein E2320_006873 [Naja naja]|nr:hypothetical protein E2320_006873 [Naja naja]
MAPPPANLSEIMYIHCGSVLRFAPSWANRLHNPKCPASTGFQAPLVDDRLKRVWMPREGIKTGEWLQCLPFSLLVVVLWKLAW